MKTGLYVKATALIVDGAYFVASFVIFVSGLFVLADFSKVNLLEYSFFTECGVIMLLFGAIYLIFGIIVRYACPCTPK